MQPIKEQAFQISTLAEDMGISITVTVEGCKNDLLSLSDKLSSDRRIKDKFSDGSVYSDVW